MLNRRTAKLALLALIVSMVTLFAGWYPSLLQAQTNPELDPSLKPYQSSGATVGGKLHIGTSETIKRLMDLWAGDFRHHHKNVTIEPETILDPDAPNAFIQGVLPVIEGAQLVALSWPMDKEKLQEVKARMGAEPIAFTVALDAIVMVVHHRNPLPGLTLPQVAAIFGQGSEKDTAPELWQQVGLNGKIGTREINRYGRDEKSGTFAAFKKMGLSGGEQRSDVLPQPGSMSVVLEVGTDEAGIGYAATGFARRSSKVRVVPLARQEGAPFIKPTNDTVLNGEYPLSRDIYIYAMPGPNETLDPTVKEFIAFVLSRDGQQLAKEDGFFPLSSQKIEQALHKLAINGRVATR